MPIHDSDMDWKAIATGQAESPAEVKVRMTKVKFIYRQQVLQVIEGGNGRKGEISIMTFDYDIPADTVEGVVKRLAYAGTNPTGNREDTGRVDSFIGRVQQGTS